MPIDQMLSTSSEDLVTYALNLSKEAAVNESLRDYALANSKYKCALFVMEEVTRELYHSLKFSNEDSSSSPPVDEPEVRVRSFTFDVGH